MVRRLLTCFFLTALLLPYGLLPAADVAPIFTLDSDDPILTLPTSRGGPNPTAPFMPATAAPYGMVVVEDSPNSYYVTQVSGLAIVGFTGDWEWSFDGSSWTPITSASETNPLGLSTESSGAYLMIRYAPTVPGSGTLTFRAWSGADGGNQAQTPPATDAGAISSPNGGAGTAFSAEIRVLHATAAPAANVLPALSGSSPQTFSASRYGSTWDLSQLTAQYTDADGDPIGIAITAVDASFGTWYYSLGSTSNTIALGTGDALLLPPYAVIWFSPTYPMSMGLHPGAITCQAWDQTFGFPGVANGVLGQLGDPLTIDVNIDSGNNSPTWAWNPGDLNDVPADAAAPPWQRLSDLISPDGSAFADSDGDPEGVAIVAITGTGWEWAVDGDDDQLPDSTPTPITTASDASAVLLSALWSDDIIIRYVPILADGGTTRTLSIRAWDQTSGSTDASNLVAGGPFSTSNNSTGLTSISVTVTSVANSNPAWDAGTRPQDLPAVLANASNPPWQRLDALIGASFLDADSDPAGIAITAVTGSGWEWAVDADTDLQPDATTTAIPAGTAATDAVLLSAAAADNIIVRYRPVLADGGATRTLTIRAWDQTDNATDASNPAATDAFSLGSGASGLATISVAVTAVPNTAPVVQPVTSILAVAGQSWQVLVTVSDADDDSFLGLAFDSAVPADLAIGQGRAVRHVSGTSYRSFTVSGSPTAAGVINVPLRGNDGSANSSPVSFTVTVVAAGSTTLSSPVTVTTSTATNPAYGAIAPGSTANFQAVNSAFGDLFTARARGVWWDGSYRDLPTLPASTKSAGILLASTVDRTFSLATIPYQAAPFAITLPANSWSLVGVPPLAIDSVPTVVQSHPWGDFRLEDLDGVVQDANTANNVLQMSYQGGPASTQPFQLSGGSYVRASTMTAGIAYWIPNFTATPYRLVRTDGTGAGRFSVIAMSRLGLAAAGAGAGATASSTVVAERSGPPAPPSGAAAPATSADGGSCGAGGLAGLLIAGLALISLRPRRRN